MTVVEAPIPVARQVDDCLPALLRRAAEFGTRVALRHNELSRWREYTWEEYATRTARIGTALLALGVQRGDRVAIHSENRPEWVMTDLAVQGIGAASVGVYPTCPSVEVEYLPAAVLEATRAVWRFDARTWVGDLRCLAAVVVTELDRLVPAGRQLELATATGATVHRVTAGHDVAARDPGHFLHALSEACRSVARRATIGGIVSEPAMTHH
jgi:non-ribosomal peptide synthetase component E (peptide arylation enzyme)